MLLYLFHVGLGSCSGLKTSGYGSCHKCGLGLHGRHSSHLKKIVFHEHRRRLDEDDRLRSNRVFWPRPERRTCPIALTPDQLEANWGHIQTLERPQEIIQAKSKYGLNRWSILWSLPYWKVDMHIVYIVFYLYMHMLDSFELK